MFWQHPPLNLNSADRSRHRGKCIPLCARPKSLCALCQSAALLPGAPGFKRQKIARPHGPGDRCLELRSTSTYWREGPNRTQKFPRKTRRFSGGDRREVTSLFATAKSGQAEGRKRSCFRAEREPIPLLREARSPRHPPKQAEYCRENRPAALVPLATAGRYSVFSCNASEPIPMSRRSAGCWLDFTRARTSARDR